MDEYTKQQTPSVVKALPTLHRTAGCELSAQRATLDSHGVHLKLFLERRRLAPILLRVPVANLI